MISLLKLSKNLIIIFLISFSLSSLVFADSKDIWQKSKQIKTDTKNENLEKEILKKKESNDLPPTIFDKEKLNFGIQTISEAGSIKDDEFIFGIYDPAQTEIGLDFWKDYEPNRVDEIFQKISTSKSKSVNRLFEEVFFSKINLNAFPDKGERYLGVISAWMINSKNVEIVDKVIHQNKILAKNSQLINFLFNYYLTNGDEGKACGYLNYSEIDFENMNLEKYKIYCHARKKEFKAALSKLDLAQEKKKFDVFFIEKINFLTGISKDKKESDFNNIFNAHLSIIADPELNFEYTNFSKNKELKDYFFKSQLTNIYFKKLYSNSIKSDLEEKKFYNYLNFLEKAVDENLFEKEKLFNFYKQIRFSVDELVNANTIASTSSKSNALIYQSYLISQQPKKKYEVLNQFRSSLLQAGFKNYSNSFYTEEIINLSKKSKEVLSKDDVVLVENIEKNNIKTSTYNNNFLYSSEVKFLLNDKTENKQQEKYRELLRKFYNDFDNKKYLINNKDILLINLLSEKKISIPSDFEKYLYKNEVFIPSDISYYMDINKKSLAFLKLLELVSSLNEKSKNYISNSYKIMKTFEILKLNHLKNIFITSELS